MALPHQKAALAARIRKAACIISQLAEEASELRLYREAADLFELECSLYPLERRLLELDEGPLEDFPF